MADDPWASVKEEVVQSLGQAEGLFARWQTRIDQLGSITTAEQLGQTTGDLKQSLKSIGWDLEDLSETIAIVEDAPSGRFNKITASEIAARKQFVRDTSGRIKTIQESIDSHTGKIKSASGNRNALLGGITATSRYAKLESQATAANDDFIDDQALRQEVILKEQDVQLGEVGQTLSSLRTMGEAIGDELEDQNRLLDDFDHDMETTGEKLKRTAQKVDKVLGITKDGKQSCTICFLIIVLIVLISIWAS